MSQRRDHQRPATPQTEEDWLRISREAFYEKQRLQAESWSPDNAPPDVPTCPNCANRVPAEIYGRNFWNCTAIGVLPAFTGQSESYRHPINIALFDPASSYAAGLNSRRCALFSPRNIERGEVA